MYYFKFYCKGVLIPGGLLFVLGVGGGGGMGRGLSVDFSGYVTNATTDFSKLCLMKGYTLIKVLKFLNY